MVNFMRIGTFSTLYGIRRGEKKALPYIDQMKHCLEVGFDVQGISLFHAMNPARCEDIIAEDWERRIDDLASEAAKLGVDFSVSHAPGGVNPFIKELRPTEEALERYNEMMVRAIIMSSKLGIKWMSVHPFSDNINCEYDNEVQLKTNYDYYAPFVEMGEKYGVGLAFENMARTNSLPMLKRRYCMNADELCELTDYFKSDYVGITWDFGHARIMMNDQREPLRKVGKRLKVTHVQDNKGDRDMHLIPFVGGNVQWEKIMPVLKEIGYEGDFTLEAGKYMRNVPEALWVEAGKIAYEHMAYCLELADK